jgi:hypothetical protein
MPGIATLKVEVTNVSPHGLWLLLDGEEVHLSFVDLPWLKKGSIEQLLNVQRPTENHLYWPQLDVDLSGRVNS